jgi:acetylserotonin N-methyltransferase
MPPDPRPVLDLIDAFRRSKVMFTALTFGIFDLVDDSPADAASVAAAINADPSSVERLLEACAALGLLQRHNERFTNTPLAATYLTAAGPQSLAGYIRYSDQVLYRMWEHFDDAVREGTPRWQQTFQLPAGAIFDGFFRTPEAMRTFLLGMHGFGMLASPAVVRAFDLGRFRRMADLGGATGHLVAAACERYPQMEGVLFDLPNVIPFAQEMFAKDMLAQSPAGARVECIAGDFFSDPLPPADLYALGRILHDWAPPKISRLLAKIVEALPPGGGLLIAEKLFDDDHLGPVHVHMQSLNMLVCTEGRERSLAEYSHLLRGAGFSQVEGFRTGQPVDAILAIK